MIAWLFLLATATHHAGPVPTIPWWVKAISAVAAVALIAIGEALKSDDDEE